MMSAAWPSFTAAWYSPSAATIFARRSRSASASFAIARCIFSGSTMSLISTAVTWVPHGPVCPSMTFLICRLMAAKRLPAIYGYRDHVDDGGLINVNWIFRRSAIYVHKILSGDAPSDLPVEFPTRLEMVVNLSRQGNRVRDSRVVSHSARRRSDRIIQLRPPCFAIRESVELPEWVNRFGSTMSAPCPVLL